MTILEELIEHYPDKPWDWVVLSTNPHITPEFVEKILSTGRDPWSWGQYGLSRNPSITPEFIERHINNKWDWIALSRNPSITPEFIERHINNKWDWIALSRNQSLTPEFVEKILSTGRDPWYWKWLSSNNFEVAESRNKENEAAKLIQRGCHNWLWKPVCRDGKLGINVRLGMNSCHINYLNRKN